MKIYMVRWNVFYKRKRLCSNKQFGLVFLVTCKKNVNAVLVIAIYLNSEVVFFFFFILFKHFFNFKEDINVYLILVIILVTLKEQKQWPPPHFKVCMCFLKMVWKSWPSVWRPYFFKVGPPVSYWSCFVLEAAFSQ